MRRIADLAEGLAVWADAGRAVSDTTARVASPGVTSFAITRLGIFDSPIIKRNWTLRAELLPPLDTLPSRQHTVLSRCGCGRKVPYQCRKECGGSFGWGLA